MEKPKNLHSAAHPKYRKYEVYLVGKGSGCYAKNYSKRYVGSTSAVSPQKACSNVRWHLKGDDIYGHNPEGILGDRLDEGEVVFELEAIEIN